MNVLALSTAALVFAALSVVVACDDDGSVSRRIIESEPAPCGQVPPPQKLAAACEVAVSSPPATGAGQHVPEGTNVELCTNPPSSGAHYPISAAFQEYAAPVDWRYLLHNLEQGGIVLAYNCEDAGCPDVVEALRKIRDEAAPDPLCQAGVKRIVVMPSPTIPAKVAAVAWGKTYTAACVDAPSLAAFVRDNYARGPENVCAPGRTF